MFHAILVRKQCSDLRGSFQLSGLRGLVSIRCKGREGVARVSRFFPSLPEGHHRLEKGSHGVFSSRSPPIRFVLPRCSFLFLSLSLSLSVFLWPPPSSSLVSTSNFSVRVGDTRWLCSEKNNNSAIFGGTRLQTNGRLTLVVLSFISLSLLLFLLRLFVILLLRFATNPAGVRAPSITIRRRPTTICARGSSLRSGFMLQPALRVSACGRTKDVAERSGAQDSRGCCPLRNVFKEWRDGGRKERL